MLPTAAESIPDRHLVSRRCTAPGLVVLLSLLPDASRLFFHCLVAPSLHSVTAVQALPSFPSFPPQMPSKLLTAHCSYAEPLTASVLEHAARSAIPESCLRMPFPPLAEEPMPNSLLYPPLCPAQGSGTGLKIFAKSSKTWNFCCQPQSASLIFLWRLSPHQQTPRWALSSQSGVHKTSPTSPPSSELPSELPSGQTLEAEEGRGSLSGPGSHLWGTSRAGEKGRVGLEGQGRVLGHHERQAQTVSQSHTQQVFPGLLPCASNCARHRSHSHERDDTLAGR